MTVKDILKDSVGKIHDRSLTTDGDTLGCVALRGFPTIWSNQFFTDESHGVTEDFAVDQIRYRVPAKRGIFKMRAGKFFRKLLAEYNFEGIPDGKLDEVVTEFAEQWAAIVTDASSRYQLIIDDDFEAIYTSDNCDCNMPSCMFDKNLWSFYRDAVSAKAARLIDRDSGCDRIVARCVIYMDVHEEGSDRVWRLGERQYAGNDYLRRLLVDALIKGGHVDGYKKVGAGCGEANAFVTPDGKDLSDRKFWIDCDFGFLIERGNEPKYSYQDSFKWFTPPDPVSGNGGRAHNYVARHPMIHLDNTDGSFRGWLDEMDNIRVNERLYQYHDKNEMLRVTRLKNLVGKYVKYMGEWYDPSTLVTDWKGELVPKRTVIQLQDGRWVSQDDVVFPEGTDYPVLKEDAVESYVSHRWWLKTECVEIGGVWMHKSEIPIVCSMWGHVQI